MDRKKRKGGRPEKIDASKLKYRIVTTLNEEGYRQFQKLVEKTKLPEATVLRNIVMGERVRLILEDTSLFEIRHVLAPYFGNIEKVCWKLRETINLWYYNGEQPIKSELLEEMRQFLATYESFRDEIWKSIQKFDEGMKDEQTIRMEKFIREIFIEDIQEQKNSLTNG